MVLTFELCLFSCRMCYYRAAFFRLRELLMLHNVKVVLVGTSHSGNIGSAARAMKVMGLTNLVLVDPQCSVDEQTIALADLGFSCLETAVAVSLLC